MCTVWIVSPHSIRAVDPAALEPKARMGRVLEMERKPAVTPQKPVAKLQFAAAPAPLQCGGDREKSRSDTDWGREDYRSRCNVSNDRNKTCGLRKRRQQNERW